MIITFTCKGCGKLTTKTWFRCWGNGTPVFCSSSCSGRALGKSRAGKKQSESHIANRIMSGENHANWKGNAVSDKGGRRRAERMYPQVIPCAMCGSKNSERHHVDGHTSNNAPSNILFLCRRCHMEMDGRLEALSNLNTRK